MFWLKPDDDSSAFPDLNSLAIEELSRLLDSGSIVGAINDLWRTVNMTVSNCIQSIGRHDRAPHPMRPAH
jgi:hypothetical protein